MFGDTEPLLMTDIKKPDETLKNLTSRATRQLQKNMIKTGENIMRAQLIQQKAVA